MDTKAWEELFHGCKNAVERFVYFKIPAKADAEDVIQEVFLTAFQKFSGLKDPLRFKAWILSIARSKCADYYRSKGKAQEIPLDSVPEGNLVYGRMGFSEPSPVRETMALLDRKDREILELTYFRELSQAQISSRLQIPLGTVKSRLHTAKKHFREKYPFSPDEKGAIVMKKLPELLPEYTIEKLDKEPFSVKWEELWGLFIVPKIGEELSWANYEAATRQRIAYRELKVRRKAMIHGVEGVEVQEIRRHRFDKEQDGKTCFYAAQLTDTHCRMLAEDYEKDGVHNYLTFLDGDDFLAEWGYGENNCGRETQLSPKGKILETENGLAASEERTEDIVGRYLVTIDGKRYDTIRVIGWHFYYGEYTAAEQYLDQNGRTILWRQFVRDDWNFRQYGKRWTEMLPDAERLTINGETYVRWYDCITSYIL